MEMGLMGRVGLMRRMMHERGVFFTAPDTRAFSAGARATKCKTKCKTKEGNWEKLHDKVNDKVGDKEAKIGNRRTKCKTKCKNKVQEKNIGGRPTNRWIIVILLLLSVCINYVDRGSLSVAAPVLK